MIPAAFIALVCGLLLAGTVVYHLPAVRRIVDSWLPEPRDYTTVHDLLARAESERARRGEGA